MLNRTKYIVLTCKIIIIQIETC
uniref:Uncharacterized protein n=1 Tax=Anguilla anguilla TaxID=7936 RepID=A0A0E9RMK4_ANGAN